MKIDLHVHSKFSKNPSNWLLKKIGCRESYTSPRQLYEVAERRGMTAVTITDHNRIGGCLELAHLDNTFISEEITAYFPEDKCKAHVLAYDITESQHRDIGKIRENIYELVQYLNREKIHHSLAHPFFSVNDHYSLSHFERLLLLFKNLELNGDQPLEANELLKALVSNLTAHDMDALSEKYNIVPPHPEPRIKHFTAGSDDHSSINIAGAWTQVEGAGSVAEFFEAVSSGRGENHIVSGAPHSMGRNIYAIAYQFYKNRFGLGKDGDWLPRILDRFLQPNPEDEGADKDDFYSFVGEGEDRDEQINRHAPVINLLRLEAEETLKKNGELLKVLFIDGGDRPDVSEHKIFLLVNEIANRRTHRFTGDVLERLSDANVFALFSSIGYAGALYSALAPYLVAYSQHARDCRFAREAAARFRCINGNETRVKVAHFTDAFYSDNDALMLQRQIEASREIGNDYRLVTCRESSGDASPETVNFKPVGIYEMPECPEQKLFAPPVLEMLDYCYSEGFTRVHSATPGPMGMAAMTIARILNLPLYGTYHAAAPQFAGYLTGDSSVKGLMWKFIVWYYDQMDVIYSPSRATTEELVEKGIRPEKIKVFPRGIDIDRFHPAKRSFL